MPDIAFLTASPALAAYWRESLQRSPRVCAGSVAALDADCRELPLLLDLGGGPPLSLCATHRVLALSSVPGDEEGLRWLQHGAVAYLHAYSSAELLRQALAAVESGGIWFGVSIMQRLCRQLGAIGASAPLPADLSARELQVVDALRLGRSNKEIAQVLAITERTVKAHLTSIFQKFDVADRLQLLLRLTR
ncbi:response regulator transcription factor [Paludibacterium yongneupense]|uniref:response regulator transcription factor n=1 Tax=Paludibacterium yongneupense TaxID=400061 RepID=UPI000429C267|nr:response regulator transcription factor [Paludibacterium yongneupense]